MQGTYIGLHTTHHLPYPPWSPQRQPAAAPRVPAPAHLLSMSLLCITFPDQIGTTCTSVARPSSPLRTLYEVPFSGFERSLHAVGFWLGTHSNAEGSTQAPWLGT